MKRFFFSLFVALLVIKSVYAVDFSAEKPVTNADWQKFLTAISMIETSGRDNIKHLDTNKKFSYGCLQIQDLYLIDSNLDYSLEDLYNREVSFKVAKSYLTRYARSYERRTGKQATYEVLARIHNGGPRGAEKTATEKYWLKVKAELEK